ncbi:hypothetical protein Lalb_Chr19g0139531 [Lupinus albus]|uniref:Uncharacterized protein n=1 Tax=Lupinus albus TaxID=3870 RepID=A0A6A4P399_LUPAL|nr:hypothetical protein Lalb_Chr19g0139531 [Lupinus albus]
MSRPDFRPHDFVRVATTFYSKNVEKSVGPISLGLRVLISEFGSRLRSREGISTLSAHLNGALINYIDFLFIPKELVKIFYYKKIYFLSC